jgi:hypothetical protein
VLEGDLGDFTLPDILKLLAFTNKTGRLGIVTDGVRGRVDLVKGQLRDASADADHLPLARRLLGRRLLDGATLQRLLGDAEALPTDLQLAQQLVGHDEDAATAVGEVLEAQALDAVFDLLRWSSGTFRFETTAEAGDNDTLPKLTLAVDAALAEAERRLSAWTEIRDRTGPGDAVVTVGRPAEASVQVDADGWQLIGLADGPRTIDELSVLCGRGQFETRSTIAELLALGVVSVGTDGSSGSTDGLLADQALLSRLEGALGGAAGAPQNAPDQPAVEVPVAGSASAETSEVSSEPDRQASASRVEAPDAAAPNEAAESEDAAVHELAVAPAPGPDTGELVGSGARHAPGRNARPQADPTIDADLVNRLISGVEGL